MERFGVALKQARLERGISQERLADLSGIGRSHVNRIETGAIYRPEPETIERLAIALDMTADELLANVEPPRLRWMRRYSERRVQSPVRGRDSHCSAVIRCRPIHSVYAGGIACESSSPVIQSMPIAMRPSAALKLWPTQVMKLSPFSL